MATRRTNCRPQAAGQGRVWFCDLLWASSPQVGKAPELLAKIEFKVTLPQTEGATASEGADP